MSKIMWCVRYTIQVNIFKVKVKLEGTMRLEVMHTMLQSGLNIYCWSFIFGTECLIVTVIHIQYWLLKDQGHSYSELNV